ncbi:nucleotide sugar dehydrogenase [Alphaproteobacteria bacterium]|nr:nucleotide sugar dehydrogenase [Alphaproteobacteria bacterium]
MIFSDNVKIGVIGLGYVGLPLAVEFGKTRDVVGFDINEKRIADLKNGRDKTLQLTNAEIRHASGVFYTSSSADLKDCNCYIITVPTPVNEFKKPEMKFVFAACEMVAKIITHSDVVIFESTVYPGATEEECAPIIAKGSGLTYCQGPTDHISSDKKIFHVGYSPERINPGDRLHKLPDIVKITSGSSPQISDFVDDLYKSIITAGTYKAPSIRVAEAAKVIENTQRDVNIALINELAKIFHLLEIDTKEVLEAASTKWNFLPFTPGLVGGHCIGVDPYYLTHKAQMVGHDPELILAGRRMNDGMGKYAANRITQLMRDDNIEFSSARVLVLGLTFKANCPDTRNSKVFDLISELTTHGLQIDLSDPFLDKDDLPKTLQNKFLSKPKTLFYDTIVLAVSHTKYLQQGVSKLRSFGKRKHVFFDLEGAFPKLESDGRL